MSKKITVWAALAIILFYAGLGPSYRAQILSPSEPEQKVRPREVLVEIKPGTFISDVNLRNQTTTIRRIYGTNHYRLQLPVDFKENDWIEKLEADPDVLDAAYNKIVTSPFTSMSRSIMSFPDSFVSPGRRAEDYQSQFQILDQVLKLGDAHLRSTGQGIVVAVIDTGVDIQHPVFASRLWTDNSEGGEIPGDGFDNDHDGLIDDYRGWDFIGNDNDPSEIAADPRFSVAGHGTFIAGLIAQVAPGSRIMPIRAFSSRGESDEFTVSEAIKYATDHGADVINLSFGSREDFHVLREAIDYATRKSVLVAAVGNENTAVPPQYPANITESVIGVAAVDMTDHRAYFSNFGQSVSVNAPGCLLISTYPGGGYAAWSGTSFATPLVVSEVALALAYGIGLDQIRDTIEGSSLSIDELNPGYEGRLGRGRIQPLDALQDSIINTLLMGPVDFQSNIKLYPVASGTLAAGEAIIRMIDSTQELEVSASGLNPRQKYKIAVNGTPHPAGLISTSSFGAFDTMLSNQSSGTALLPIALDPVTEITLIQVLNEKDEVVLTSSDGSESNGGSVNSSLNKEAVLTTSSTASVVMGKAQIDVSSVRESLSIKIEGLTTGSKYQIVVDGIHIGSVIALSRSIQAGFAKITYTSDGSSGNLLVQSLRPAVNIRSVKILQSNGQIFAEGSFQP